MDRVEVIFDQLKEIIANPSKTVKAFKEQTGKNVIGCFPLYCPEELIHAAGMLPIGIWGGETEIELAKQYLPAFACSIMQSCLEYGMKGTFDDLSAVIIPGMCDTLIGVGQNWKTAVPNVEYIPLVHPQNRKIKAGITYLESEYRNIKVKLEEIGGCEITNEAINHSIEIYNSHRKMMREFVEVASKYPNIISPLKRNIVIKSAFFMEKSEHTALVTELILEIEKNPEENWNGKRVLLSGIVADSENLLNILSENNLAVVADDLGRETRQIRYDVPVGEYGLERLAKYWSIFEGCSLAYDPKKQRNDIVMGDIKKHKVDGVIFCMMKFCDPEEYDYPIIKKDIEKNGIPTLHIEIDQQTKQSEQTRTRIQTFAEILNS